MQARYLRELPHSVKGLRCRLMFMELKSGRMVLDAVVSSGTAGRPSANADGNNDGGRDGGFASNTGADGRVGTAQPGSLVTVVAQLPTRPWGFAAKATLERWIDEGREVNLRLKRRRARRAQVEAVTEEASMLLDLAV